MKIIMFMPNYLPVQRLFKELEDKDNVEIVNSIFTFRNYFFNKVINVFRKFHFGMAIFKITLKKKFKLLSSSKDKSCFFFCNPWIELAIDTGYIQTLKKKYPNAYFVAYLMDVHKAKSMDIQKIKIYFDDVYVFDKNTAEELKLKYYPLPYSRVELPTQEEYNSDIYFVGQAKSRLNELLEIFEYCEKNNIKTSFYITGVKKEEQRYSDKIHYRDNVPYEETLKIAGSSNCGLELLVEGAKSYSQRVSEALINNKKLITNNPNVRNANIYIGENVRIFNSIWDVDPMFIKERAKTNKVKNLNSPIYFLDYLEKQYEKSCKND